MAFALFAAASRARVQTNDFLVSQKPGFVFALWPFALVETGQNQVRPFVRFRLGIGKQMDAAVKMVGFRGALYCEGIENFFEPAEIAGARKFCGQCAAPAPRELLDLRPTIIPVEVCKDRFGFG